MEENLLPIMPAGTSKKFKTGSWKFQKPEIDNEKCIRCQQCIKNCPEKSMSFEKEKNEIKFNEDFCKGCGICSEICPSGAIKMTEN
jgi:pyruvate ferredoxin oxidoreductase delta subunit